MISVKNLNKNFVSYIKEPGFVGSLKSFVKREKIVKSAVKDFSFEIEEGKIVGLLGPNGAGKTTLMKMLTGIIVPSSGEIQVAGHIPWERKNEFKKNIALVMGQKSQLWWDIPAMDSFLLLQKYYDLDDSHFQKKLSELSELLNVKDLLNIHLRKLSLGERMKMELMACLFHSPKVIFLDEPTIGLDLVAQENIRKFLLEYHQREKVTIILTSHYMADIEALCSELILVQKGEKRFDGKIDEFTKILGPKKLVSFQFCAPVAEDEFFASLESRWDQSRTSVELSLDENKISEVSIHILKHYKVDSFSSEKMPIERVMKSIMEESRG
jgi:ABC-2 type transport system ATP-binding protein